MKKTFLVIIMSIAALSILSTMADAETVSEELWPDAQGDIVYDYMTYNIHDNEASLASNSCFIYSKSQVQHISQSDVVVPETISHNGQIYTVTAVYLDSDNVNSLIIPDTVKTLNVRLNMNQFTVPSTIEKLYLRGSIEFLTISHNLEGGIHLSNLKTVTFLEGVDTVSRYLFFGCDNLNTVIFPNTITMIDDQAFSSCKNLKKIELPDSLQEIGPRAFWNSGLTEVKFPDQLKTIGERAFYNTRIKTIDLPEGLETIDQFAFGECSIRDVTIPDSVSYIGHDAFDYSTIEHIHFPENLDGIGTPTLYDKNGGRITAPSEIAGSDFQRQFDYLVKVESKLPPADQGHEGNNPGSPNNAMTAAIIAIIVILGILVSYVVVKKRQ